MPADDSTIHEKTCIGWPYTMLSVWLAPNTNQVANKCFLCGVDNGGSHIGLRTHGCQGSSDSSIWKSGFMSQFLMTQSMWNSENLTSQLKWKVSHAPSWALFVIMIIIIIILKCPLTCEYWQQSSQASHSPQDYCKRESSRFVLLPPRANSSSTTCTLLFVFARLNRSKCLHSHKEGTESTNAHLRTQTLVFIHAGAPKCACQRESDALRSHEKTTTRAQVFSEACACRHTGAHWGMWCVCNPVYVNRFSECS